LQKGDSIDIDDIDVDYYALAYIQECLSRAAMFQLNISVLTLTAILVLVAFRQIGGTKLHIWQIMLLGASTVLLTGQISPYDGLKSINPDVMIFLFGMFVTGEAMHRSGFLLHLSYRLFGKARSLDHLVLLILFGTGILSAFLMNDTLAIIGTPLVLYMARSQGISPKLLLLSLAFGVTTGSVMSPIGNPQNLLIAINGDFANPFVTFVRYLFIPTMANLFLAYLLLRIFYKGEFLNRTLLNQVREPVEDVRLALVSEASFILLIALVVIKITMVLMGYGASFRLTYIALISSLPILIFSQRRMEVVRNIDWHTLVFFASMFVLMASVWQSGVLQSMIDKTDVNVTQVPMILALSVILSQLVSNVPFVALYLPLLHGASIKGMMALAAGSTIAGNLFILGAASNVIIIQNAEKENETLTFLDFARVGIPLTILNLLVYWIFLLS
jgi:Na+/H+ antiporter NhaD/arsenite permease-like protein